MDVLQYFPFFEIRIEIKKQEKKPVSLSYFNKYIVFWLKELVFREYLGNR